MLSAHHPLGAGHAFSLALGVYWNGRLEGVLTFGNPIANNAGQRYGLRQAELLELRKMWLSDKPDKNAESRTLAVAALLIRKHYPRYKMLITYCSTAERAASYRGAGWIEQKSYNYLREVKIGGRWVSIREVNRRGGLKRLGIKPEGKYESRVKFVLPLNADVAQVVARLASSKKVAGASPSHPLLDSPTLQASVDNSEPTPIVSKAAVSRAHKPRARLTAT